MDRRRFLAAGAVTTLGIAGCLGDGSDPESTDGNDSNASAETAPNGHAGPEAEPGNENGQQRTTCGGAVPSQAGTTAMGEKSFLIDGHGRAVIPRGVNVVYKREPYYPPDAVFDESDVEQIRGWGFNFVRLGAIWAGVEPERGEFDQAYLDRIHELVGLFADHDIYVLLDYHQNLYSHVLGGDGAPEWAVYTDGELADYEYDDVQEWALNYGKPAVSNAFENFFTNHEGIQDEYARAWRQTAKRLRGEPNVVGYSLMNEPTPAVGLADFETEYLPAMYNRVIAEIRTVDEETPVWVEPSAASFNVGSPTSLSGVEDPADSLVFSFHNYAGDNRAVIQNAVDAVDRLEMPGVQTEFSTGNSRAVWVMVNELEARRMGWAYWPYDESTKGWMSPAEYPPDFIGLDEGGGRKHLDTLVRPYPQAVAGRPTTIEFDRVTRTFRLEYQPTDTNSEATGSDGGAAGTGDETVIFVPERQFAEPAVSVEGASVRCQTDEYLRVGDHTTDTVTVELAAASVYEIESVNSEKLLGVTADGNAVQQSATGTASQQWRVTSGEGGYRIANVESGAALGVTGQDNGANVRQQERGRWQIELVGDGIYRIEHAGTGKVLDVTDRSTADGANVQQWAYTGGDNQQWRLRRLSSAERAGE
jgi:endoglycosylceramidase